MEREKRCSGTKRPGGRRIRIRKEGEWIECNRNTGSDEMRALQVVAVLLAEE